MLGWSIANSKVGVSRSGWCMRHWVPLAIIQRPGVLKLWCLSAPYVLLVSSGVWAGFYDVWRQHPRAAGAVA